MKSILISIAAMGLILAPAVIVSADTSTASVQTLIQTLQAQIATLQAQLNALVTAQSAVIAASGDVTQTATLLRNLREGMSGDDVKTLQAILAKYPDIYPEGLISGFFGKATAKAVRRFQQRENLDSVGTVGPRTLARLLKELEKDPLDHEEDDEQGDNQEGNHDKDKRQKHPCAIVPPGHLIAPGWLRKHGNDRPIVPPCQKLRHDGKHGDDESTTPDTTAPVISGISARDLITTSVHIAWNTNEKSTSKVWYATTSPIVAASTTPSVGSFDLTKGHNLGITGLAPHTTHYFVVVSSDRSGNSSTSSQQSFITLTIPDTTAPVISGVSATMVTGSTAHIVWATDELADSSVWYSTSTPVNAMTASTTHSASLVLSHDSLLSNLATSTTYYYLAGSVDGSGNRATSTQSFFMTLTQ